MHSEFDKFAKEYEEIHAKNIKISGYDVSFFDEQKIREIYVRFGKTIPNKFNILNFGCGIGKSERYIRKYFPGAEIYSADVSIESINIAKERNKNIEGIHFYHFNRIEEFAPSVKFEVIFVANVFHHIPEEEHIKTLKALYSLLTNDGFLFIFEHNPINPITQIAFRTCEFDKGCKMIPANRLKKMLRQSGFVRIDIRYILFFPHFLNFLLPLEKFLKKIPIGAQYYAINRKI